MVLAIAFKKATCGYQLILQLLLQIKGKPTTQHNKDLPNLSYEVLFPQQTGTRASRQLGMSTPYHFLAPFLSWPRRHAQVPHPTSPEREGEHHNHMLPICC